MMEVTFIYPLSYNVLCF